MLQARILPIDGGRNFRDFGGYRTQDGGRIRWGQLYRSGVLTHLTDQGRADFDRLGIQLICDLRSTQERVREPSDTAVGAVARLQWDYGFDQVSLRGLLNAREDLTPELAQQFMLQTYQRFSEQFADRFAEMFRQIATQRVPVLVHCTAGKDRTGIAVALILLALGVPRDQILEDYELTNRVLDLETRMFSGPTAHVGVGEGLAHLNRLSRESRAPFLQVRREYLDAALAQIESDHGSVENYLSRRLQVTPSMREHLRAWLVE